MTEERTGRLGATPLPSGECRFVVWAPWREKVEVRITSPGEKVVTLRSDARGTFEGVVKGVGPGARYLFRLDGGREIPDPASRFQPLGVHGPSEVVDLGALAAIRGDRGFACPPLADLVFYEIHVGTFTRAGTFEAAMAELPRLAALGVNALEIMPVAQFPGGRNWGYDGVFLFAAQDSYGGPEGLARLVAACHDHGIAAFLDVVYNHLGPEGNVLHELGPYFTSVYHTPWGSAINLDDRGCDEVRRFFIENALQWTMDYGFDGLRLDAVHALCDRSASPFLEELAREVKDRTRESGRTVHLVAESDLNDPRLVTPPSRGGLGLDAMWSDDLHHTIHALLTGETNGYYEDFGRVEHLARAWERGATYGGEHSAFRGRRHGRPLLGVSPERLVVCTQNHDQVGNRMLGERLTGLLDAASLELAAAVALLSPFTPLLFMGEEYGETAPFLYFTSHGDEELVRAVRKGRKAEFETFSWKGEPPDPQSPETYRRCVIDPDKRKRGHHLSLHDLYTRLLAARRGLPRAPVTVLNSEEPRWMVATRGEGEETHLLLFAFEEADGSATLPIPDGSYRLVLDAPSARARERGYPETLTSGGSLDLPLPARSFAVYRRG
jgi:maltooligosyltrehalose trehalohydrolase